jgi:hypothetical protein
MRKTILAARAEALAECEGLRARIAASRDKAVVLLENTAVYGQRNSDDEAEIVEFERQAARGEGRVEVIMMQLLHFDSMLDALDVLATKLGFDRSDLN